MIRGKPALAVVGCGQTSGQLRTNRARMSITCNVCKVQLPHAWALPSVWIRFAWHARSVISVCLARWRICLIIPSCENIGR